ncbi:MULTISPECIES: DUF5606 domain-containing protein [unclassified Kaistella]|uniref:DUF5606 family protein n=1 Tax=unclassified Kaistella TaxID=2762626 RepID=UPI0027366677|nr:MULTISPECIES: DUF5606 domain-containing protein [unclassified Kaistella]MCZ2085489.1 DUF5606 domain-containing protein [Flavobacteriales bacterium]MDP2453533.1 DUF5606 domain-containing protein [Kaistella sp. SH11-4b]MDP2456590.1 DUF5606 domain-containing protein [Kaistella sp. SH40-3]MDP2459346.1 DUF5606 domain-containing protein [Kaistella sp. SH19-2b]
MQLEKIISISGKPGLYKLISQLKNGFIIEDVLTKKKVSISNSSQVSLLDNIAMFTFDKEVPLFQVFENVAKNSDYKETVSHKSTDAELREFMTKSLPDYDHERVYVSDIKKLAQWYNILHKAGYITPESFVKTEEITEEEPAIVDTKDAKKTAPKKEKTTTPKAKASTAAKSAPKSTHRKMG